MLGKHSLATSYIRCIVLRPESVSSSDAEFLIRKCNEFDALASQRVTAFAVSGLADLNNPSTK